ncbi:MAG: hypothetical protein RMH84_00715 [Sulfolobales archaeon]|nr:hypothetical protein [Sulfolobales archaeon]MCX8208457.1 hypothetical protein [Sulfolobales archaeon]MDW8010107.1 hypothetical protein [Sulfolobales archaeon]
MSLAVPKNWRRNIALALGAIGIIMIVAGVATGYIDVSLWGVFAAMMGQAIMLQERKRPG